MNIKVKDVKLECVMGNIAAQNDVAAVVNAANAQLMPGGGVAGAIHRTAGEGLKEECRPLAPISPGEAVITGAYNLPNKYVIHCLGPVYGRDKPEEKLLSNCYKNSLELAEQNEIESIAFPAVSAGAFGYPKEEAAEIAIKTILHKIPRLSSLKLIRFVIYGEEHYKIYIQLLNELTPNNTITQ